MSLVPVCVGRLAARANDGKEAMMRLTWKLKKVMDERGAHFMVRTCAPQSPAQHPRFFELVAEDCSCMLCTVVEDLSNN